MQNEQFLWLLGRTAGYEWNRATHVPWVLSALSAQVWDLSRWVEKSSLAGADDGKHHSHGVESGDVGGNSVDSDANKPKVKISLQPVSLQVHSAPVGNPLIVR